MTHGLMCYIHEGEVIKGTICSLYIDSAWYSDLNSRNITLEFDIAESLSMRYLAFAISSNNYEWEVLHVQDKQNNTVASVTIPETYNGTIKLGVKLYDTPPAIGSILNVGFDYVITGGINLTISANGKLVTMTCGTAGAVIRYTIDGTDPTEESTAYAGEFEIDHSCTIKARAYKDGLEPSDIASEVVEVETDPMQSWTAISDMKFGSSEIRSVCYANGKFVAVGASGKASYSTDGITWTAISDMKFGTSVIRSICYGNNKFVAVGASGKGAYSTDGITWTAISDMTVGGSSVIRSICYGNNKFVAVGYFGSGEYSTDGITWTAISDMKFDSSGINSICYANGKFVAVGDSGKASYSTDGITWTAISDMKMGTSVIYSVCYGNGKFVAVGWSGKASYSTDGITWTAISDMKMGTSNINSICYANGKFVAVGSSGKASYSTDGITWTAISDMKMGTSVIYSVCYGNDKFVAVGGNGKGSYCEDDGGE